MPVTAVGFDLDYTLAVPERDRAAILEGALEQVGGPELAARVGRGGYLRAHREHHVAETRAPVFAALLDEHAPAAASDGVDPEALAAAYREGIADALRPVAGAADLVRDLRERYRVGLLTNGPAVAQRDKLAALGWTDAFDAVVITGELGHPKPDPEAFAALCESLDAPPGGTVYVGDDPEADVAGGAGAGLRTVQVLGDRGRAGDTAVHPLADATVERSRLAADLPDLLAGLDGG